jgi:hypothetical protein
MTDPVDLLLWPDRVDAFYADGSCSLPSAATRKTSGTRIGCRNASIPTNRFAGSRRPTHRHARLSACARTLRENRLTLGARSRIIVVLWHAH